MAQPRFSFFLALLLCLCSYVLTRQLTPDAHGFLDVPAAIQKTLAVLSFDPRSQSSLSSSPSPPSAVLSLELHPRNAVRKTPHRNYSSLITSTLRRDAARVTSLHARLELALAGVKISDLTPLKEPDAASEIRPESLGSPLVSGISQGSGEYFARVGFGSPSRLMYVVPDTGSDINWIQCRPCASCYTQADPVFDPRLSSSYVRLPCGSPKCSSLEVTNCRDGGACSYEVSYGDGSYTMGDFATETLSFGSRGGSVSGIAFGCGHDNEGLFVGSDGLIGLGGGPLSLTSQLKAPGFSYCLVDRDSNAASTIDFDSARPADSITAPLSRNRRINTFLYVGLDGLSVGPESLSVPSSLFQMDAATGRGGVIVDSGTSVTRLPTQAYNALRDAFRRMTRDLPAAPSGGYEIFDTCYDLSSQRSVRVPTVAFRLAGGKSLPLPARNFLVPVDSAGTFCLAFAPTTSSLTIIGNIQQQGTRVSYDLAHMVVGFSLNKC